MVESKKGKRITLKFDNSALVNHAVIMEDYREGERIREYWIEGLSGGRWVELTRGTYEKPGIFSPEYL